MFIFFIRMERERQRERERERERDRMVRESEWKIQCQLSESWLPMEAKLPEYVVILDIQLPRNLEGRRNVENFQEDWRYGGCLFGAQETSKWIKICVC